MSGRHIGTRFPSNEAYLETLTQDALEALADDANKDRDLRRVVGDALGVVSDYTFEEIVRRVHVARKQEPHGPDR